MKGFDWKNKKILVTGGAGFIGSTLVPDLLEKGCKVRVLDNLKFGGFGLLMAFRNPNLELVIGDVRDKETVKNSLEGVDAIIHLAAIVGYPACKRDPQLANDVNYKSTIQINNLRKTNQLLVMASTGSNYGHVPSGLCNEKTPLSPLTVYGETKTKAEKEIVKSPNVIIYRFSTGFGLSPRLRLDLMVNDFTFKVVKEHYLLVYEKDYRRTFIHVKDMSRAFMFAIENAQKMKGEVYNVGDESLNVTKEEVVNVLKTKLDFVLHFTDTGRDEDQRNYEVDFTKIRKLGFKTTVSLEQGIEEMIRAFRSISLLKEISNTYSNV